MNMIKYMARDVYYTMTHKENFYNHDLTIATFKRFITSENKLYEATEGEFISLIKVYRIISGQYPNNIMLDDDIKYDDQLDKRIGTFSLDTFCNSEKERIRLIEKTVEDVLKEKSEKV